MDKDQKELKVISVGSVKIEQFQTGSRLAIFCHGAAFTALVVDPQKGQAIVRMAIMSLRDVKATVGSRPFKKRNKIHLSRKADPKIRWGEIVFGYEVVLRNEDTTAKNKGMIFYTARQITAVSGPRIE